MVAGIHRGEVAGKASKLEAAVPLFEVSHADFPSVTKLANVHGVRGHPVAEDNGERMNFGRRSGDPRFLAGEGSATAQQRWWPTSPRREGRAHTCPMMAKLAKLGRVDAGLEMMMKPRTKMAMEMMMNCQKPQMLELINTNTSSSNISKIQIGFI